MPYSVVVVTWQCADHLTRLVETMNRELVEDPELIVVDNASTDRPAEGARRWRGPCRVVELAANEGFGAASNIGVAIARHDSVVLLNPDTELVDPSLGRLARLATELRALVGPRVLNSDRSIQPSASGPPVGIWPWIGALTPQGAMPAAVQRQTEPWRLQRCTRVSWLTGACVAGPRDLLSRLGPFDPAIHLYGEDMDLGLRAARAGAPSILCPRDCRIVHHGDGASARRFPDAGRRLSAANRAVVVQRLYGAPAERRSRAAEILKLLVRAGAKQALGRGATRERRWLRAHLTATRTRS